MPAIRKGKLWPRATKVTASEALSRVSSRLGDPCLNVECNTDVLGVVEERYLSVHVEVLSFVNPQNEWRLPRSVEHGVNSALAPGWSLVR